MLQTEWGHVTRAHRYDHRYTSSQQAYWLRGYCRKQQIGPHSSDLGIVINLVASKIVAAALALTIVKSQVSNDHDILVVTVKIKEKNQVIQNKKDADLVWERGR